MNHRVEYPDHKTKSFFTLDEYLRMAERCIGYFCWDASLRQDMLSSEDAISYVAHHLMKADWTYDASRGTTPRAHRNGRAQKAIKNYLTAGRSRKNRRHVPLTAVQHGVAAKSQDEQSYVEQESSTKKISFLLENSGLTPREKDHVTETYLRGSGFQELATERGCSRQSIEQSVLSALHKMRVTAGAVR